MTESTPGRLENTWILLGTAVLARQPGSGLWPGRPRLPRPLQRAPGRRPDLAVDDQAIVLLKSTHRCCGERAVLAIEVDRVIPSLHELALENQDVVAVTSLSQDR